MPTAPRLRDELHVGGVVLTHEPHLDDATTHRDLGVDDTVRVVEARRERFLAEQHRSGLDRRDREVGVGFVG